MRAFTNALPGLAIKTCDKNKPTAIRGYAKIFDFFY